MLSAIAIGIVTGMALIVAIGAQNAFILRQGLRREHVAVIVTIAIVSDVSLILAGVAGIGAIISRAPETVDIVRWFGVAFLTWYGLSSLWRAFKAESLDPGNSAPMSRRGAVTRIMALTWLNPHVYLDTVLLLGSIGNQHGDDRWWFALGAAIGSTVWFSALGFGAQYANRWLRSERSWKILEIGIGFTMLAVAVQLALM